MMNYSALKPVFWTAVFFTCLAFAGFQSRAAESATQYKQPVVCEIRGTVADLRRVQSAPVPSPLAGSETLISVSIEERTPRYRDAAKAAPCQRGAKAETQTYKLCSPTRVKPGDVIHGTEGLETGPAKPVGCLFDLVVLSQN